MSPVVRSIAAAQSSRDHRRLLKLQSDFARRGFALDPLIDDKLLVQRWGLMRVFDGLDAAQRFLVQLGEAP